MLAFRVLGCNHCFHVMLCETWFYRAWIGRLATFTIGNTLQGRQPPLGGHIRHKEQCSPGFQELR